MDLTDDERAYFLLDALLELSDGGRRQLQQHFLQPLGFGSLRRRMGEDIRREMIGEDIRSLSNVLLSLSPQTFGVTLHFMRRFEQRSEPPVLGLQRRYGDGPIDPVPPPLPSHPPPPLEPSVPGKHDIDPYGFLL